jgi:chromosome segregation ATPase
MTRKGPTSIFQVEARLARELAGQKALEDCKELSASLQQSQAAIATQKREIDGLKTQCDAKVKECNILNAAKVNLTQERDGLIALVSCLKNQLKKINDELVKSKNLIVRTQSVLPSSQSANTNGNESLADQLVLLRRQVIELQKCHKEQCDRRQKEIMQFRQEAIEHHNTIADLERQVAEKEQLCENYRQEIVQQKVLVEHWVKQYSRLAQTRWTLTSNPVELEIMNHFHPVVTHR